MTIVSTHAGSAPFPSGASVGRRLSLVDGAAHGSAPRRPVALSTAGGWMVTVYPSRILGHVDVHIGGTGRPTIVIAGFKPTGRGSLVGFGGEGLADAFHGRSARFGAVCDYLLGMPAEHEQRAEAVAVALASGASTAAVDAWLAGQPAGELAAQPTG